jgi:hypothetical protein
MTTSRTPKRHPVLRWSTAFTLIIGLLAVTSTSAQAAAAPSNDDITNAVRFSTSPFRATADTSGATTAETDPGCGGATVWYRFRPHVTGTYVASTQGSDYDTMVAVLSGTPTSLSLIECSDDAFGSQAAVRFEATHGTTYYIQVGTCCGGGEPGAVGPGGNMVLTVGPPPPNPRIKLRVRRARAAGLGRVKVIGSVKCNQNIEFVEMNGTVRQKQGLNLASAVFSTNVPCSKSRATWTAIADNDRRVFQPKRVEIRVTAEACNPWACRSKEKVFKIKLTK